MFLPTWTRQCCLREEGSSGTIQKPRPSPASRQPDGRKVDSQSMLPLIVTGARQVGKTESILKFAKENYVSLVYVNFAENPLFSRIVDDGYSPDKIIRNISLVNPAFNFVRGKTLIFFDEIQACPEIASSLRFFKLDGRYDVVCSGSLLGVQFSRIESISVGYQTVWKMTSLDFEEFLWACGYGEGTAEDMRQHVKAMFPFSENELDAYESLFFDYMVVGGMPPSYRPIWLGETSKASRNFKTESSLAIDQTSANTRVPWTKSESSA